MNSAVSLGIVKQFRFTTNIPTQNRFEALDSTASTSAMQDEGRTTIRPTLNFSCSALTRKASVKPTYVSTRNLVHSLRMYFSLSPSIRQ